MRSCRKRAAASDARPILASQVTVTLSTVLRPWILVLRKELIDQIAFSSTIDHDLAFIIGQAFDSPAFKGELQHLLLASVEEPLDDCVLVLPRATCPLLFQFINGLPIELPKLS